MQSRQYDDWWIWDINTYRQWNMSWTAFLYEIYSLNSILFNSFIGRSVLSNKILPLNMMHSLTISELKHRTLINHSSNWEINQPLNQSFNQLCNNFQPSLILYLPKYTLSDKISSDKIFVGQNFRHQAEISTICPIFAWLLYWNIGQNFRRTKFFVGHKAEISTILSDEFLSK